MLRLLHAIRGVHEPLARAPLGGWRCACGKPIADLQEAGTLPDGGFVPPVRRVYTRANGGQLTRTAHWEPTRRGD